MKKIEVLLISILSIILVGCLFYIGNYKYNLYREDKNLKEVQKLLNPESNIAKEIAERQQENVQSIETEDSEVTDTKKEILSKYKSAYEENNDLVGWIKIDDTKVDYPVMQTSEDQPEFYIHKDWNKADSVKGLPFVDYLCDIDSSNLIIYAHHMKDGSMFGSLKYYQDESYFKKHKFIKFDTLYEEGQYEIIAVCLTKVYYENPPKGEFQYYYYSDISSEKKFEEYVSKVKSLSLYDTGKTATYGDKLITLCTCMYHTENGRMIVVAKKIN